MEKRNQLNLQGKLSRRRHTSVIRRNQLREISTVRECYCGKEGQSDEFRGSRRLFKKAVHKAAAESEIRHSSFVTRKLIATHPALRLPD